MEININQLTAAEYVDAVVNAGMDGYVTLLRGMAERKTKCTDPALWSGLRSCSIEVLDALDHFIEVAQGIAQEIADDEQAVNK